MRFCDDDTARESMSRRLDHRPATERDGQLER